MLKRVLAALLLSVLAAGPWVRWVCAHSCVPVDQVSAVASACHAAPPALPRVAADHDCDGQATTLTVVASRTESALFRLALADSGTGIKPRVRATAALALDDVVAGPPPLSRVGLLRI